MTLRAYQSCEIERDLHRAIMLFRQGVLAMRAGDVGAIVLIRDELAAIVARHDAQFPELIIDRAAEQLTAMAPHASLRDARHCTGLDCTRITGPRVTWLDLTQVDVKGNASAPRSPTLLSTTLGVAGSPCQ
jgi:hypothetical protein